MKIWVMRHGEAGFNAPSDRERTLTEKGKIMAFEQGKKFAQRFIEQGVLLDKMLVSPYVRTQQTFEQFSVGLQAGGFGQNCANLLETWDGVTPAGDAENVMAYLDFLREEGAKNVMVISHLPLVFDLIGALTLYQASVHFYPAVIAEVEWGNAEGKLRMTLQPSA